jgi:hypothetical protein
MTAPPFRVTAKTTNVIEAQFTRGPDRPDVIVCSDGNKIQIASEGFDSRDADPDTRVRFEQPDFTNLFRSDSCFRAGELRDVGRQNFQRGDSYEINGLEMVAILVLLASLPQLWSIKRPKIHITWRFARARCDIISDFRHPSGADWDFANCPRAGWCPCRSFHLSNRGILHLFQRSILWRAHCIYGGNIDDTEMHCGQIVIYMYGSLFEYFTK